MREVPFFPNTEDDTHCFQAAFKMVLKYFRPDEDFSYEQLETLSNKKPGMSTWPQSMLINLDKMGFGVQMVEGFDVQAFIQNGSTYLEKAFGKEVADWQVINSDIPAEQRNYQAALDAGIDIQNRIPAIEEALARLSDNTLLIFTINSSRLNNRAGYTGHAVVVYEADDNTITLHDPGLPPQPGRKVPKNDFVAAWSSPTDEARSYIAITQGATHE